MLPPVLGIVALFISILSWLSVACTEGAPRQEAQAELSPPPRVSPPAPSEPAPAASGAAGPSRISEEDCPVLAQRQTRLYYTARSGLYSELLAQRQKGTQGIELVCFPNETVARESGFRSDLNSGRGAQTGSGVQAAPEAPKEQGLAFRCTAGKTVRGEIDRWSPLSKCPEGYQVTGIQRLDLIGDHKVPITHVNDLSCGDDGCKAWCIGAPCTVEARCCRIEKI